jgi:putative DNA primase/helicase
LWQKHGLAMPPEVQTATKTYRSEQDVTGRFLAECCRTSDNEILFKTLYQHFENWCDENGENCPSRKFLSGYLEKRGYTRAPKRGTVWFQGITILDTANTRQSE